MEVRQARAADWGALRELRLRALADAPDAFASTLEEEAFPEQAWRQRAEGGPASANIHTLVMGRCSLLGERLEPGQVPADRGDHLVPDQAVEQPAKGPSGHPVVHRQA